MSKEKQPRVEYTAWDPGTMGYGHHEYQEIDPDTINLEDYATRFEGEQQHTGEVREYNSADNEQYPENDVDFLWMTRKGTIIRTEAAGLEGEWMVADMPTVKNRKDIYVSLVRVGQEGPPENVLASRLGIVVNRKNLFEQVKTVMVTKAKVGRKDRIRLTQL